MQRADTLEKTLMLREIKGKRRRGLQRMRWLDIITNSIDRSLFELMSTEPVIPSNRLVFCHPLLLLPSIVPRIRVFFSELDLHIRWPKYWELQLQHQPFQWIFRVDFIWDWLVWSPCCPRYSQESYPALQFENINSLVLSLLYGPALTTILLEKP